VTGDPRRQLQHTLGTAHTVERELGGGDAGGGIGTRRIALIQDWPAFARSVGATQR
jgi:hypothetical protein